MTDTVRVRVSEGFHVEHRGRVVRPGVSFVTTADDAAQLASCGAAERTGRWGWLRG
jgi:hypothetical protein